MAWSEIRMDFEEEGVIFVDAWKTECDNEEGKVIAKVFKDGEFVKITYLDEKAKTDTYAQEVIREALQSFNMPILDESSMLKSIPEY